MRRRTFVSRLSAVVFPLDDKQHRCENDRATNESEGNRCDRRAAAALLFCRFRLPASIQREVACDRIGKIICLRASLVIVPARKDVAIARGRRGLRYSSPAVDGN